MQSGCILIPGGPDVLADALKKKKRKVGISYAF